MSIDKSKNKNITVIVSMTDRIDSAVAAYLLKKQGYNCVGVGIVLFSDEDGLNKDKVEAHCDLKKLDAVKSICDHLEIPFYAINGVDQYKNEVLEFASVSRLSGEKFPSCIKCNEVRMNLLLEKFELLKADYIATGHYARVNHNKLTDEYFVSISNDIVNDQSFMLGTLERKHLEKLMLPLADLRQNEVDRISTSIGISFPKRRKNKKYCFCSDNNFHHFVERNTPVNLRLAGTVVDEEDDLYLSDHDGIHHHYLGQKDIHSTASPIDPHMTVVGVHPRKKTVILSSNIEREVDYCGINRFNGSLKMDYSLPVKGYCKLDTHDTFIACTLFIKNNGYARIDFKEMQKRLLFKGEFVVIYDKNSVGGKIIGSGYLIEYGEFEMLDRTRPVKKKKKHDDILEEEEEEIVVENFKL